MNNTLMLLLSFSVQFTFLAVVDIVNLRSTVLLCGHAEKELAVRTYGGATEGPTLPLKLGCVSRKKDFIPALSNVITSGWKPSSLPEEHHGEDFGEVLTA